MLHWFANWQQSRSILSGVKNLTVQAEITQHLWSVPFYELTGPNQQLPSLMSSSPSLLCLRRTSIEFLTSAHNWAQHHRTQRTAHCTKQPPKSSHNTILKKRLPDFKTDPHLYELFTVTAVLFCTVCTDGVHCRSSAQCAQCALWELCNVHCRRREHVIGWGSRWARLTHISTAINWIHKSKLGLELQNSSDFVGWWLPYWNIWKWRRFNYLNETRWMKWICFAQQLWTTQIMLVCTLDLSLHG